MRTGSRSLEGELPNFNMAVHSICDDPPDPMIRLDHHAAAIGFIRQGLRDVA